MRPGRSGFSGPGRSGFSGCLSQGSTLGFAEIWAKERPQYVQDFATRVLPLPEVALVHERRFGLFPGLQNGIISALIPQNSYHQSTPQIHGIDAGEMHADPYPIVADWIGQQ